VVASDAVAEVGQVRVKVLKAMEAYKNQKIVTKLCLFLFGNNIDLRK